MDSVFFLSEEERASFLQTLGQAIGCTYLCLWSYHPLPSNHLFSMDGWYNDVDTSNLPSSSSGSSARRFFDAYRQKLYSVENGYVPGLAFKEGASYIELMELELLRRSSNETQRQFYQEARIKTAAFMGCKSGEIEIGMSIPNPINMEMKMRDWFPDDIPQQSQLRELPCPPEQNRPSSSSSSLRSLSVGSPECPPLFLNVPNTSYIPQSLEEAPILQAVRPTSTTMSYQQTMQAYNLLGIHFLNPESDDAAMTRAMLAVMSSPSSSSSSYQPQQHRTYSSEASRGKSAFKKYISLAPINVQMKANPHRQNMSKRAIALLRSMNMRRIEEQAQGNRPTSSQLHHKISERKRREKLNEGFQELRSLLPPGSKKDKGSVLSNTKEYLSTLKAEVRELQQKNQALEARVSHLRGASEEDAGSSSGRINFQITQVASESTSTSVERDIDLRVTIRGECNIMDLIIRILEFLKQVKDVSLVFMEADSQSQQMGSFNQVLFRFKTKGSEWDESAFEEAMKRVVADVVQ